MWVEVLTIFFVFFFFKVLLQGLLLKYKLRKYPGYTQFLPKYFPKIPYLNPYGMERPTVIDIEIRKNNPKFEGFPFIVQNPFFGEYRLVVSDASVVREIMLNNFKEFPKLKDRMELIFGQYGSNILISEGDEWRKHRILCNPAFSKNNLELLTKVSFDETLKEIQTYSDGKVVDVNSSMNNITLNIILKAGFGYNLDESVKFGKFSFKENIEKILSPFNLIFQLLCPSFIKSILYYLPFETIQHKHLDNIKDFGDYIDAIIKKQTNEKQQNYDLLSLLLTSKDGEQVLTNQEVKADSFIFLLAGHDTTACQLSWSLYEIAKNQEIQNKLYREITENVKETPKLSDFENLKYTSWVVNESLRLHAPIQGVVKESSKAMTLKGEKHELKIIPGLKFLINFKSIHTDPRYWKDPLEFKPERFSESINPSTFLPFSLGPRKCIGMQFSLVESSIILATLLKRFSVHLVDSNVPEEMLGIVSKPKDLKLIFKERK
jgi:cytochrome P450